MNTQDDQYQQPNTGLIKYREPFLKASGVEIQQLLLYESKNCTVHKEEINIFETFKMQVWNTR